MRYSLSQPALTFDQMAHRSVRALRLQLLLKERWELEKSTDTAHGITRACLQQCYSSCWELIYIPFQYVHTHTHAHAQTRTLTQTHTHTRIGSTSLRSQEGSRKSIREPSPFTFISHLFLIPPFSLRSCFLSCFFPPPKCVWSIFLINQCILVKFGGLCRFSLPMRQVLSFCVCVCTACMQPCLAHAFALSFWPQLTQLAAS